ncbi:MAG: MmcQ/YjbR family DNA-binding protein [Micromonosporaceae bacterium]
MATWEDVRRIAMALPEATERPSYDGTPAWRVKDKLFVWERPLRPKDLAELGDAPSEAAVLGTRVPDLGVKEALLAEPSGVYFTTSHFNGYPAVLVWLDRIAVAELEELLAEAWLARAPKRLAQAYLADSGS